MATLPTFRRILREDVPNAPTWIDIFISVINQFFETTYQALNRNLTFRENFNAQIKEFQITAGASPTDNTFSFPVTLTKKPEGLLLLQITQVEANYTPLTSPPYLSWRQDSGTVYIDSILGLTSGKKYNLSVLVI